MNIDVLCTVSSSCFVEDVRLIRACDVVNKKQKPFRLVNGSAVSIHHVANAGANWRSAFIFGEHRTHVVNRWFAPRRARPQRQFPP
ncbi:hypothetical protein [Bradyrhizobium sp.]|uniref:hypothetical protein n=1 Tax=Bradyrhizobium sp. TaxID=376 RepID=UPI0039E33A26